MAILFTLQKKDSVKFSLSNWSREKKLSVWILKKIKRQGE